MPEEDTLQLSYLLKSTDSGNSVDLPSIDGFAKIAGLNIEIYYQDGSHQKIISTGIRYAIDIINMAINSAFETRRSEAPRLRLWD